MYRFKTEVAVGPDGQACYVSIPYPGSVHDMKIFCNHIDKHLERLEKGPSNDREIDSLTIDSVGEAKMWAALMDRGYQGASKLGRFITPRKRQLVVIWIQPTKRKAEGLKKIEFWLRTTLARPNYCGGWPNKPFN